MRIFNLLRLRLSAIARITVGLTSLLVSLLFVVALLGLFPDQRTDVVRLRAGVCETAAIGFSFLADSESTAAMQQYLAFIAERNRDIVSIGVRREDGHLLIDMGEHAAHWDPAATAGTTPSQVSVQLFAEGKPWGTVETCFAPLPGVEIAGHRLQPGAVHGGALTVLCLVVFYFYLRVVLRQLNPSQVVPRRVREALDTLAEGLLVLDRNEHIVLANRAFSEATGMPLDGLTGVPIARLPLVQSSEEPAPVPWQEAIRAGKPIMGRLFGMSRDGQEDVVFSVSASPIVDEQGRRRGVLASFENVTLLERRRRELSVLVDHLRVSSDVLKHQNRELERLATRDPLTNLLSRRPFFERLDEAWKLAARHGQALSVVMVDVDHFKAINDTWGHIVGDEVLRHVAGCLRETVRETDIVCRYGGEEFAVLMPHTDITEAALGAERCRQAIEKLDFGNFFVTVSAGVSSLSQRPPSPQELLDQADKCLYFAKRSRRNMVVRWDEVPSGLACDAPTSGEANPCEDGRHVSIPFHAITALISALAYRDQTTAEHSRRVADLCVATAEGLLSFGNCYVLEVAALLHDIGKIGVPDHILLKPGPLTPDEWTVMRQHDRIGAEIIRAAFASQQLSTIVEHYQAHFGDPQVRPELPTGHKLPLGARILAIADAYDSMATDRPYRDRRTSEEALAELRRCAGTQFDPELVERFISVVRDRGLAVTPLPNHMSREVALAVGLQIERLLAALDARDHSTLGTICGRLRATAGKYGVAEIAEKASDLNLILDTAMDVDEHALIRTACELLDLCRSTQTAFLKHDPILQPTGSARRDP